VRVQGSRLRQQSAPPGRRPASQAREAGPEARRRRGCGGMNLLHRLLSQSTVIFGARLFGAGLTFLVQVAISRFLGSQALGEYILVMATVNIIAVMMPLGFEATGTYFAAEYRARGEGRLLRGFMVRA